MKREIKFRGKRVDNGEWVIGSCYFGNISKQYFIIIEKWVGNAEYIRIIPETVGQFTGLTDKNGKDIFEGDIYNHGDNTILYHVVWHDTGLKGKQINSSSYAGLEYWQRQINVIGNIYSNPELLK